MAHTDKHLYMATLRLNRPSGADSVKSKHQHIQALLFTELASRLVQPSSRDVCVFFVCCPITMKFISRPLIGQHMSQSSLFQASHWSTILMGPPIIFQRKSWGLDYNWCRVCYQRDYHFFLFKNNYTYFLSKFWEIFFFLDRGEF